nr:immunoglobulin light chain junction region [Macaca mulatta]
AYYCQVYDSSGDVF